MLDKSNHQDYEDQTIGNQEASGDNLESQFRDNNTPDNGETLELDQEVGESGTTPTPTPPAAIATKLDQYSNYENSRDLINQQVNQSNSLIFYSQNNQQSSTTRSNRPPSQQTSNSIVVSPPNYENISQSQHNQQQQLQLQIQQASSSNHSNDVLPSSSCTSDCADTVVNSSSGGENSYFSSISGGIEQRPISSSKIQPHSQQIQLQQIQLQSDQSMKVIHSSSNPPKIILGN